MNDNEQIILFRQVLSDGLAALGAPAIPIVQFNQPTIQGTFSEPCYYFSKLSDKRIAFSGYSYNKISQSSGTVTQVQRYETGWQVMAIAKQTPGNISERTAGDWVTMAADILNSDPAINAFHESNAAILCIKDIRSPVFLDDNDEFMFTPSFDFYLIHNKSYVRNSEFIDQITANPEQV